MAGLLVLAQGAPARAATESVIYSFRSGADGASPEAPLVAVGGTFYGTTYAGGGAVQPGTTCSAGCGTVFSLTPDGTETVLHRFQGGADGANPTSGLLDHGGLLFGTTLTGGLGDGGGHGTVFSITPTGGESLVANFTKAVGVYPDGPLTVVGARLFGTTNGGYGFYGPGSVYLVTPTGKPRLVHAFNGAGDGRYPRGALLNVGGTLYGTTFGYGANFGTVFAITPAGQETVLHTFADGAGDEPNGGLVDIGGTLFGTTQSGGPCGDCGTVFKITTTGTFTLLHAFTCVGSDGCAPLAGLTRVGSILYGTTYAGGANGDGMVFSITQTGVARVVYDFRGGADGGGPTASLLNVNGTLYGTTYYGGAHGRGTVFKIVP